MKNEIFEKAQSALIEWRCRFHNIKSVPFWTDLPHKGRFILGKQKNPYNALIASVCKSTLGRSVPTGDKTKEVI